MKYVIDKKKNNKDVTVYSFVYSGLKIEPNKKTKTNIVLNNIVLSDQLLIDTYVKKRIDKKFTEIFKKIYYCLNSDDTTDADAAVILGETARLKSILINKYKEYITEKEYKTLLKKIILIEEEFKIRYGQKLYYSSESLERRGKSR